MKEICQFFKEGYCISAITPATCEGAKERCHYPERYRPLIFNGMTISDARKRIIESQEEVNGET